MKKKSILYSLLFLLLIINCFFLYNYLGKNNRNSPKASGHFIVKELNFNSKQLDQFKVLEQEHHNTMQGLGYHTKMIKEELFNKITASKIEQITVDSLILEISKNDILKEKEIFKRLRGIYQLCDDEQKARYSEIIKKARKFNKPDDKRPRRK